MKSGKAEHAITDDAKEAAEAEIVQQSKRIEFYITEYSLELLANKMRNNEFNVPSYQREFTWEQERKSRFIESVIMGLPIPFLFFWEMEEGQLEIVDGSQRLRTVEEFILGDLRLGSRSGRWPAPARAAPRPSAMPRWPPSCRPIRRSAPST